MKPGAVLIVPIATGGLLAVDSSEKGLVLPGGKVEPEETLIEGAIRELFEETGTHLTTTPSFVTCLPSSRGRPVYYFKSRLVFSDELRLDHISSEGPVKIATWFELLHTKQMGYRRHYEILNNCINHYT